MPRRLKWTILFALLGLPYSLMCQNITVINQYGDTTGLGSGVPLQLTDSQQHTLIINYYEPASEAEIDRLEKLIGSALDYYIDESVEIKNGKVNFKKGANTVQKEMNQIVKDGIKFYKYKEVSSFSGFSDLVGNKIAEIEALDLRSKNLNVPSNADEDQYAYYFVQKHLNDLKLLANTEIGNYSNDNLMVVGATELEKIDPQKQAELLAEINNFKQHDPLKPLQVELPDATVTFLASEDQFTLPEFKPETTKDDFAEKVFNLLEQNTNKLDQLQSEVDELRRQQEEDRIAAQERTNQAMQGQIDELRDMIVELVSDRKSGIDPIVESPKIENLPGSVEIGFPKGNSKVDGVSQFILNEVIDLLARHPSMKVMVTGFADKTGDAQTNMLISQRRARGVREYLLKSGLSSERVIMNYFGDRDSGGENPDDRKVVIEFIQY